MVQSVERAFELLELLASAGPDGLALGDLAARARLKPPTAHNLVRTLETLGYARQEPTTRRYALGARAEALGGTSRLMRRAASVVAALRERTDESIVLAAWSEGRRRTLVSAESGRALRVAVAEGVDDRFYTTATGRVLLASVDEAALAAFVATHGLPGAAWPQIASAADLSRALAAVRQAGWTRCDNAQDVGAWAVPVVATGDPVALGLYCPASRVTPAREKELLAALAEAARQLSDEP